jgi:DNA gyrase subunit A
MSEPFDQEKEHHVGALPRSVEEEITKSYIEYAMSVIVSRALPDVRDGLKPVLRRILFAMYDIWLTSSAKHKKSAAVVWEVLWKYHPHGDSSVYDAMVRMAQPFSLRYPLVNGQGNFGSIDGDEPAAMRYTEAKLTKIAEEMLEDIQQDTVDWRDTYDQSRKEPMTLPTKFPFQLCNGTMGIAVGMATNMPPHNLWEVIDACLALIDNPDLWLDEIMDIIQGPDFPTGWIIFDTHSIKEVYAKWRWPIITRGKVHFEVDEKKNDLIIVDEIPYQVNKANLVAKIAELVNTKKIDWITDITDESSKDAIRIVIQLRKWASKEDILTRLYKYSDLQSNFNVNNVTLTEQWIQPKHLNIKQLLEEFVSFRRQVVYRRSVFQLDKARSRLHILEWLQRALDILDAVIETIKSSNTREEAKQRLMEEFAFSPEQAEYILMLRLQTLVWLEIQKILNEIWDKKELIAYLEWIINDPKKLDVVVIDELVYVKDTYGDERRTQVSNDTGVYDLNSNIAALKRLDELTKEPVITWIDTNYNVKILYQSRILNIPPDTRTLTHTHNQDHLIVISANGELFIRRLKDLGKHTTQGEPLDVKKECTLKHDLVFSETMGHSFDYICMLTNQNNIKKIEKKLLLSFKKFPTIVMGLQPGEKIIKVVQLKKWESVGIISSAWSMLVYPESQIRPMGKTSWWVKAIDLDQHESISDMFVYAWEPFIFLHDDSQGKMISIEDVLELKRWTMKRWQVWRPCAPILPGQVIKWAIAINEWSVNLLLANGQIEHLDSDTMALKMPEDSLSKITNGKIIAMFTPWQEKE